MCQNICMAKLSAGKEKIARNIVINLQNQTIQIEILFENICSISSLRD